MVWFERAQELVKMVSFFHLVHFFKKNLTLGAELFKVSKNKARMPANF